MRGTDGKQAGMFSYISPEQRIPADHPLRAIREMTDEVLRQLSRRFAGLYPKAGRPSIAPEKPSFAWPLGEVAGVRLAWSPLDPPGAARAPAATVGSLCRMPRSGARGSVSPRSRRQRV